MPCFYLKLQIDHVRIAWQLKLQLAIEHSLADRVAVDFFAVAIAWKDRRRAGDPKAIPIFTWRDVGARVRPPCVANESMKILLKTEASVYVGYMD